MKQQTYTLELLTPCFCAGADQAKAEIRAPAIRGQLRWWFRSLGGNAADERAVFGGVAGTDSASSLIIRISDLKPGPAWQLPTRLDMNSDSYVYHFAKASADGKRWTTTGAIPPKTTFKVHFLNRRALLPKLQAQLVLALRCFLQLGAIGLRATRGLGAFICHQHPFTPAILAEIATKAIASEHRASPQLTSVDHIAREIGGLLKGTRKATAMSYKMSSPFGSSSPRQTSAIYFRPVRTDSAVNICTLVIFEAPHNRVLGPASKRAHPVVGRTQFTKPI